MEKLTIREIAQALKIPCPMDGEVQSICTDSRQITPGCLFVAIQGENFDGHDFVWGAIQQGAVCALVHHPGDYPEGRTLLVEDTLKALLALSAWYRSKMPVRVVGVTGSVGKTTTKEMTAAVLSARFSTIKTQGNLNNEIGAPKTLFTIEKDTQAAVVEMGMTGLGEIRDLALAAKPEMGIITNIGVSHLERLGTRENILRAKLELAECLPDGAPLLLCGDNDLLQKVKIPRLSIIFYGIDNQSCSICGTIKNTTPFSTGFSIAWEGKSYDAFIPGAGKHLVLAALAAFGAGVSMGMKPEEAVAALRDYTHSGMRQKVVEKGGVTVVEDCYNASPDSMAAALDTLGRFPAAGRRIFVVSDMLELGESAPQLHYQVGEQAAQSGVDLLLAWGELSQELVRGASEKGLQDARFFSQKEALTEAVLETVQPGDLVWFKGSRCMKLEEVVERLYQKLDPQKD